MNIFIKESQHDSQWLEKALKNEYGSALKDIYCNMQGEVKSCRFVILHKKTNQKVSRTDIKKIDDLTASFEKSVKAKARRILSAKGISKMDISCVTRAEKGDDMKMICQIKWR